MSRRLEAKVPEMRVDDFNSSSVTSEEEISLSLLNKNAASDSSMFSPEVPESVQARTMGVRATRIRDGCGVGV